MGEEIYGQLDNMTNDELLQKLRGEKKMLIHSDSQCKIKLFNFDGKVSIVMYTYGSKSREEVLKNLIELSLLKSKST